MEWFIYQIRKLAAEQDDADELRRWQSSVPQQDVRTDREKRKQKWLTGNIVTVLATDHHRVRGTPALAGELTGCKTDSYAR